VLHPLFLFQFDSPRQYESTTIVVGTFPRYRKLDSGIRMVAGNNSLVMERNRWLDD